MSPQKTYVKVYASVPPSVILFGNMVFVGIIS